MKKLCEFSTVWADWADLGSTETAEQKLQNDSNFTSKDATTVAYALTNRNLFLTYF